MWRSRMSYGRIMTHPWMSPTTVTGALTCTTFDSRMSTSFVFSHISRSSASCSSCFRSNCSMQASRSKGAIAEDGQGEGVRTYRVSRGQRSLFPFLSMLRSSTTRNVRTFALSSGLATRNMRVLRIATVCISFFSC